MARLGTVGELLEPWRRHVAPAIRRARLGILAVAVAGGLLVARQGAPLARTAAGLVFGASLAFWFGVAWMQRRREREPRVAIRTTLLRADPKLGEAALRAWDLAAHAGERPERGSRELADLHVARLLGRAPTDTIAEHADRVAWRWTTVGFAFGTLAFVAVAADPFRMVEGLDVLLARGGIAPLPIEWVENTRIVAEAPAYLGADSSFLLPQQPSSLPVGSVLTVRAEPRRDGRMLVLTDGVRDSVFEADGRGGMVAHWTLESPVALRVGARFGPVLIPAPGRTFVDAIDDLKPVVRLEGAPGTVRLLEHPRIPLHWEARDDHGLTKVELVLRAGDREQRRELSRSNGAADRGGIDLLATDPFLAKTPMPVEVVVEALDGDPIRGPKWGRSASIVIVPPQVGEPEALRFRALLACRDALTDRLAPRVLPEVRPERAWFEEQRRFQRATDADIEEKLGADYGGLRVPARISVVTRGLLQRLDTALKGGAASPGTTALKRVRDASEAAVLGMDSMLEALAMRDTQRSAKRLSDVAIEAGAAIELGREPQDRERAQRRLAAAVGVLEGGGRHLVVLGSLGRDIGEIVESGLGRIDRAMKEGDRHHARLAADDLALRLRTPDPSFRSSGAGSMGGTEAGGAAEDGAAAESARESAGIEQALEELRRDHASEVAGVESALDDALDETERDAIRERMRSLAQRARESVKGLPEQSADPSSLRSEASQARSQAEAMAGALERGSITDAGLSGRRALERLEQVERQSSRAGRDPDLARSARAAEATLREVVREAERLQVDRQKRASDAARSLLEKSAERERALAERARRLRAASEASEAPLPEDMLEKLDASAREMDAAATEFERRAGSEGLDRQRQAQRLLELAQPEGEEASDEGDASNHGGKLAQDAEVPGDRADERAARFRRRVTEGLRNKAPSHLRDALRRYTEGLLQ